MTDSHFTANSNVGDVTVTVGGDGSVLISAETDWTTLDGIFYPEDPLAR
jgi:hypothetical protein